jgi:hypothetical protein
MLLASTGYPFAPPIFDLSSKVLTGKKKEAVKEA